VITVFVEVMVPKAQRIIGI